jgi:hypothetical protein
MFLTHHLDYLDHSTPPSEQDDEEVDVIICCHLYGYDTNLGFLYTHRE